MIILGSDFGFESFENIKNNSIIMKNCDKVYCVAEFMGDELYIDYVKDIKVLGKILFERLEHVEYSLKDLYSSHFNKSDIKDIRNVINDILTFDKLIESDDSYIFKKDGHYGDEYWYVKLGIYKDFVVADFKVGGNIPYDFKIETYIR